MSATAQLHVGGVQSSSPGLRIFQAMTGTSGPRVITWHGEGITVVSIPSSATEPTPPNLSRHRIPPLPAQPRISEPASVSAPAPVARADGQADDARRRSALDVRTLLHQTAQQLIDERHAREQQAAGGSSDGSVLTHDDERNARMDTVKR
jgi:hypothetical protein